ncbi:MAG: hypothetical protein FJX65_08550 [Alphaproteobacteria bacterium]|nr:hypothetical protein [Alphaproteobacteria bacterium]
MATWVRVLLVVVPLLGLVKSSLTFVALPHDAYIWQRRWTPALQTAIEQSTEMVRAWRILAAHVDGRGRLVSVAIDRTVLAASGRPVVLVVFPVSTPETD